MLKAEIENGQAEIYAAGSAEDTILEVTMLIKGLYQHALRHGPEDAEFFKAMIQVMVSDESPVWLIEGIDKLEIIETIVKK